MDDPTDPPAQEPSGRRAVRVRGVALVLVVVLLLLIVGARQEITRSWGLGGDQGELLVEECWSDAGVGTEEERARCRGRFVPQDGGEPYVVDALVRAAPGERLRVGADGPGERAYRADLWGRWAAVGLPLLPVALLWILPWVSWMLRRPGRASRRDTAVFLVLGVAPAAVVALLGAVGFCVALAVT